jgi:hypothetical protein
LGDDMPEGRVGLVCDGVAVTVAVALSQRPSHLGDQRPPSRRVAPP